MSHDWNIDNLKLRRTADLENSLVSRLIRSWGWCWCSTLVCVARPSPRPNCVLLVGKSALFLRAIIDIQLPFVQPHTLAYGYRVLYRNRQILTFYLCDTSMIYLLPQHMLYIPVWSAPTLSYTAIIGYWDN